MNDPTAQPIDIEEQRVWLTEHRNSTGFTWSELAKRTGVKTGTLSQFGGQKGYAGDEQKIAEAVFRYRQELNMQASFSGDLPQIPGYFETRSSRELTNLLHWGKRGRIVCGATGSGIGKSETSKHFRACFPNVYLAEMSKSSGGLNTMQIALLRAMGVPAPKGTPLALTHQICDIVRSANQPLIIIDEAQHLSENAIEEIRHWNDVTGVGIAFLGNIKLLRRFDGGTGEDAFAQLSSRIRLRFERAIPLREDAVALAEAWQIFDEELTKQIISVSLRPGGLRNATNCLEVATMMAALECRPLQVDDLQSAWAQISRHGGAA